MKKVIIVTAFILLYVSNIFSQGKMVPLDYSDKKNSKINGVILAKDQNSALEFSKNHLPKWSNIFLDIPTDLYSFGRNLFSQSSIKPFVLLSALTLGAMTFDQKNWENTKILCKRSPMLSGITSFTVNLGDAKWQVSATGATILYGYFTNDDKVVKTSIESIEAILSSGLFTQIIKRVSGRQSPASFTRSGGHWDFIPEFSEYQSNQPGYYSFPSGHITSAAAVLTVINENYPDVSWLKPVSYIILGALGFSLVANDMHWYSDLPLGTFIGYSFGKIVTQRYQPEDKKSDDSISKIEMEPLIDKNSVGLLFQYSF